MSFDGKISYPIGGKQVQGGLPTAILNTLQFNAVTNQWEFVAGAVASLSDLEFLRDKELSGDLISSTGISGLAAPITITSITPAAGKTFFIAKSSQIHSADVSGVLVTELQNNGTIVDNKRSNLAANGIMFFEGTIIGDSLVGDGIVTYRIQKTTGAINLAVAGTILGWVQNT